MILAKFSLFSMVALQNIVAVGHAEDGRYLKHLSCLQGLAERSIGLAIKFKDNSSVAVIRGKVLSKGKQAQNGLYILLPNACYTQALAEEEPSCEFELPSKNYFKYDSELGPKPELSAIEKPSDPKLVKKPAENDLQPPEKVLPILRNDIAAHIKELVKTYQSEKLLVAEDPKDQYLKIIDVCGEIDDLKLRSLIAKARSGISTEQGSSKSGTNTTSRPASPQKKGAQ